MGESHSCGDTGQWRDRVAPQRSGVWWLELYTAPPPEIIVPHGTRARLAGVRVHQSTQWDSTDVTVRRGIPCTGVERTILDCGAVLGERTVERLAEAAIRKEYTSWPKLLGCLREHSRRGRDGCLDLRRVLEHRLSNQQVALSDFSLIVANLLEKSGISRPVLEYRIADHHGNHILQTDLAWPEQKKAWELDGLQFHFGRTDIERNRAKSHGWNIQEILCRWSETNPTS